MPVAADPIPATVLGNPIIGEGRRFDGKAAPSGWLLAQGQSVNVADNPHLFAVLGTSAGGDGKTTFKLPNPSFGFLIAASGMFPTSPQMLAQSSRRTSAQASLGGPGATPRMPVVKTDAARTRAVAESLQLRASAPRVTSSVAQQVSAEADVRFHDSRTSARAAVRSTLSAAGVSALDSALESVANGTSSLHDAVLRMASVLSGAESTALLAVSDARMRSFHSGFTGGNHPEPQFEAASFVVSVGFSDDQQSRFLAHQQ